MSINPFVWDRPLEDPTKIVGMDAFAREVALTLKGQTNVALLGARGCGKSTFTTLLTTELEQAASDAPAHTVVRINLERAFSIPALMACIQHSVVNHPSRKVRRAAAREVQTLEQQLGFDLKVISSSYRRQQSPNRDAEALHEQLCSLARLGENITVIFDEFQRLNRCPGEPLSILRSALLGNASNVSLLLTGSIRESLELMFKNSREPLFNQAAQLKLPRINRIDFLEYLEAGFQQSGKTITEPVLEYLLDLSQCHPRRTQQLAWATWRQARELDVEHVQTAYDYLLNDNQADFVIIEDSLASGDQASENERRALYLVAGHDGESITSRQLAHLYGLGSHTTGLSALKRLRRRGLVDKDTSDNWHIIDPFLAAWLKLNSPVEN